MLVTMITAVWCKCHQHLEGQSNEERNGEDESEGTGNGDDDDDDVDHTMILQSVIHWGLNTAAGKIWTHKKGNVTGYLSKSELFM